MVTDIKKHGWIEKVPTAWRPYVYLGRFDRSIGIWLLLLPGWWSIALVSGEPWVEWRLFSLFAGGAVVMRAAGCVVNDIWDRDLDRQVGRTCTRPLAAGMLSVAQALIFLVVLLLLGLLILSQMNVFTIALGVVSVPLIAIYPLMKRVTWWPQAFLGLVFNFGVLMGWSAVSGGLSLPAFLLYFGGLFWTLAYDTIYAHQDVEDDALIGVRSAALRTREKPRLPIIVFYIAQSLLWGSALFMLFGAWGVVCLLPVVGHLIWQIRNWNPDDPVSCLKIFKSNRDLGLLFFAAIIVINFYIA